MQKKGPFLNFYLLIQVDKNYMQAALKFNLTRWDSFKQACMNILSALGFAERKSLSNNPKGPHDKKVHLNSMQKNKK